MGKIVLYFGSLAVTLYVALLYSSSAFLMLFYLEILLPVILFLSILPLVWKVRVRLRAPIPIVESGEEVVLRVAFDNDTRFLCGRVRAKVKLLPAAGGSSQKLDLRVCLDRQAREQTIEGRFVADQMGNLYAQMTRVWVSDLFGLCALPVAGKFWKQEREQVLVLPKITETTVEVSRQSRDFAGESEEYSQNKKGDDPAEIFQIRDYQPGDRVRSIHWKLSAKTEDLMVHDQSLPLGCPVLFFLEYEQKGKRRLPVEQMEAYWEIVASLSYSMSLQHCRHYVIWYDTQYHDVMRWKVEQEEDVYEMLLQLGGLAPYRKKKNLQELYQHKYHEPLYVTGLRLDCGLKLYVQDEKICGFQMRKRKEQLQTLLLRV